VTEASDDKARRLEDEQAVNALRVAGKTALETANRLYRSTDEYVEEMEGNKAMRLANLILDAAEGIRTVGATLLGEAEIWKQSPPPEDLHEPDADAAAS
jgi:hypothetical protein